jgi:hypothetical protein
LVLNQHDRGCSQKTRVQLLSLSYDSVRGPRTGKNDSSALRKNQQEGGRRDHYQIDDLGGAGFSDVHEGGRNGRSTSAQHRRAEESFDDKPRHRESIPPAQICACGYFADIY